MTRPPRIRRIIWRTILQMSLRSFGRVSRFQHLLPAIQWSPNLSTRELEEARSVAPFVLVKSAKWQRTAIRRVMLRPAYLWACIHSTYCSICGANQFERIRSTVVGLRKYCSNMATSIQRLGMETIMYLVLARYV